jgi:biotin carboxyl carrier protein
MPRYRVAIEDREYDITLEYRSERYFVTINGHAYTVKHTRLGESRALLLIDNESLEVDIHTHRGNGERDVFMAGMEIRALIEDYAVSQMRKAAGISHAPTENVLKAPMPGLVVEVKVRPGDQVAKGQPLVVVEAMKMENIIKAKHAAVVRAVKVAAGTSVEKGDPLLEFE